MKRTAEDTLIKSEPAEAADMAPVVFEELTQAAPIPAETSGPD